MNVVKASMHLASLQKRHRELDEQIAQIEGTSILDQEIVLLKKQRLALRDEIIILERTIEST